MSIEMYGTRHDQYAELMHYGVKGMKWGVRRKREKSGISRRENRRLNKEAETQFYNDKANKILSTSAKKGNDVLVRTRLPGSSVPTLATGKDIVQHMSNGGTMDIKYTEIIAVRDNKNAKFKAVKDDEIIGTYKKQNFRKKA